MTPMGQLLYAEPVGAWLRCTKNAGVAKVSKAWNSTF
jgi:hypothetical protein